MKVMKEAEFVLPNGQLATFKSPTFSQWWLAHLGSSEMFLARLVATCVEIDGQKLSADQWFALDFEDISPAVQHVVAFLERVNKYGKGVG
jgi:hypothetical protein